MVFIALILVIEIFSSPMIKCRKGYVIYFWKALVELCMRQSKVIENLVANN
jgi:hypothetical protein